MSQDSPPPSAYAQAGVDVAAARRLVPRLAELARLARRPEVIADVGSFAGLFRLGRYRDPVLVASTDSVGTKVKLGALLGRYEGLGHDVVNQNVNDIITTGAEPLFFLDYIGCYGLDEEAKVALVRGVAEACRAAGCALLGGETADLPGVYAPGDLDLVGFVVGVVERDAIIDGSRIAEGDALLGLPSSGLHTNGFSLARKVFGVGLDGDADEERERLGRTYPGLDGTLGDALLRPHRCYYNELKPLLVGAPLAAPSRSRAPLAAPSRSRAQRAAPLLKGIAHITGGGLPGNIARILPEGLGARIDRSAWAVPPVFRLIQSYDPSGERCNPPQAAEEEMYGTFNMGIGIVLAVAPADVEAVRSSAPGGPEALLLGEVVRGTGDKRVVWA